MIADVGLLSEFSLGHPYVETVSWGLQNCAVVFLHARVHAQSPVSHLDTRAVEGPSL